MHADVHDEAARRLAGLDQRYTRARRLLVEVLADAGRPLTVPEVLASAPGVPQSSAYRNVTVLIEAGVARRVAGADDHSRYELAEDLMGHHHHLVCTGCAQVIDVHASIRLERALEEAAAAAEDDLGFEVTGHTIDLLGRCVSCR